MRPSMTQMSLAWAPLPESVPSPLNSFPDRAKRYPRLRYMGSKNTLLPWIFENIRHLSFDSALDLFSGTAAVSYLLKSMGKRVVANDFLKFTHDLAIASIQNADQQLGSDDVLELARPHRGRRSFIERTFAGIFFTEQDLRFLDTVRSNLEVVLREPTARALALAALTRACLKRQPRGVFTVTGAKYDDGRRDLRLPLSEHFKESVQVFNELVFDNGRENVALRGDAFDATADVDLVYMDPPYVPRADDNCYIKRYHFLEGLASYWRDAGTEIVESSRVKKIPKRFTPFSYRRTAVEAFDAMFRRFADQILVLSYSSNGYPDLETLVRSMKNVKRRVEVVRREHRYHFGTHKGVADDRKVVDEYLLIGF